MSSDVSIRHRRQKAGTGEQLADERIGIDYQLPSTPRRPSSTTALSTRLCGSTLMNAAISQAPQLSNKDAMRLMAHRA